MLISNDSNLIFQMLVNEGDCVFPWYCYHFSLKSRKLIWTYYFLIHSLYSFSRLVCMLYMAKKNESPLIYKQIHKKGNSLVPSMTLV